MDKLKTCHTYQPAYSLQEPRQTTKIALFQRGRDDGLLGIIDLVFTLRGFDEIWIFFLESCKILFSLPVPYAVTGKDEVHLLQRPLVRLRVECPNDEDAGEIDRTENVKRLFIEPVKDGGEKKHLLVCVLGGMRFLYNM